MRSGHGGERNVPSCTQGGDARVAGVHIGDGALRSRVGVVVPAWRGLGVRKGSRKWNEANLTSMLTVTLDLVDPLSSACTALPCSEYVVPTELLYLYFCISFQSKIGDLLLHG